MNLRKLIKEELEKVFDEDNLIEKFDQDLIYLKGFKLNKKEEKDNMLIWVFEHKSKDYTLRFYIQKNKINDSWTAKIFIYWKLPTKEFTNAKGKDYEYTFGPFYSYKEMIVELNRKLENNPLISTDNYLDDNKTQFDNDIIEMLKVLKKEGDKLKTIKDRHFDDLKKIFNQVEQINKIDDLKKYVLKKASESEDKQTLLIVLQKIFQLNFYLKKEQLDSLF